MCTHMWMYPNASMHTLGWLHLHRPVVFVNGRLTEGSSVGDGVW